MRPIARQNPTARADALASAGGESDTATNESHALFHALSTRGKYEERNTAAGQETRFCSEAQAVVRELPTWSASEQ